MKFYILKFFRNYKSKFILIILLTMTLPIINNLIPLLSKALMDKGILSNNIYSIITISISIIIAYGIKYVCNNLVQTRVVKINLNLVSNLKKEILSSIINLPITFHDSNSSQYILSRINEVDNLSKLFSSDLIMFFINIFTSLLAFYLVLKKNFLIALLTILFIPIFLYLSNITFKKINAQIINSLEISATTNKKMHSTLKGTLTLKQFNEEETLLKSINEDIDNLSNTISLQSLTVNKNINLISFYTMFVQTILICIVAIFVTKGNLSTGDYLSIGQYIGLIYAPILLYQNIRMNIKPALIACNRLKELCPPTQKLQQKINIKSINQISVSNLEFEYTKGAPVLKNVSFDLNKGDKLLISGSNGSGKTTLSKLLLGFYDDYSGKIVINDKNLNSINKHSLRDRMSIVPQENYLFDMSILENIKIANNKLTEKQFFEKIEHLKSINLFKGINLNNNSLENGKNLSGGQIQRISLARILIRDFDVCIFDEITNSLDRESQEIIKNIIKNEFDDKICIFISHNEYLDDLITKKINI